VSVKIVNLETTLETVLGGSRTYVFGRGPVTQNALSPCLVLHTM